MKKLFLISTVLFWAVSCQEKGKSTSDKLKANADSTFTIKVLVSTNIDSLKSVLPESGAAEHFIKFKVVEVINGQYGKNEIRVKWRASKSPLKRWVLENGKTYTLTLKPSYFLNSDLKEVRTGYYEQLDGGC
jgi:hypothetical protein